MKGLLLILLMSVFLAPAMGQEVYRAVVKDKNTGQILQGVSVTALQKGITTNDSGQVVLSGLPAGKHNIHFSHVGYQELDVAVTLPDTTWHIVLLAQADEAMEEVTVIASTRNNQRIESSPLKVEVLGREEMEEENSIRPGNIASILGDVSGIQIQQSSATSGNANVRIQGLDGRYTQILRDGMPLYDGFSGGFGVMQIPPLDLKQIELIKGSASTLYGGGAIGGLVNLISKTPKYQQEGVLTLNQTSLKETNFNTYAARRYKNIGYNFFGAVTHQDAVDVDHDIFSDVPKLDAIVIHPRLFIYPGSATTMAFGYTGTFETRNGGDVEVIKGRSNATHQFFEKNESTRHTADMLIEHNSSSGRKLTVKGSISSFDRSIATNKHFFKGNELNYFTEASLFVPKEKYSWVAGVNIYGDRFTKRPSDPIALEDYSNNIMGIFAQATANLPHNTILEAGLRLDHLNEYQDFLLPRIALFHRFNDQWATRLGVGLGYKTPDALAVQNTEYPIEQLQPLPDNIRAEKSIGYNAEVNYKKEFNDHSSLFINQAFFLTQISRPLITVEQTGDQVGFMNADKPMITRGFDTYVQFEVNDWELYAGYTYTIAERKYLPSNQFIPLTPRNRMAFVVTYAIPGKWRFGLEGSYTGKQYRDNDTKTPDYMFMAAMIERKLGKAFSVVLNCENLLDERQSRHEALYSGPVNNPVFKPLWAPIDGRVVNVSVRWDWARKK